MKRISFALAAVALTAMLATTALCARGGAGGGGRAGGGAARPAGGTAFDRSPSMSRSAPAQRPAQPAVPAQRPPQAAAPAQRPAQTPAQRPAQLPAQAQRPAQLPAQSPATRPAIAGGQPAQRPNQSQLNNFLNLPQQSAATRNTPPAASQLPAGGSGFNSKTVTTPGGSTITAAGGRGSVTTPGGATIGGAAGGIKVEGAGGNTYTKAGGAVGASNGVNSAGRAGSATAVQGRNGYTAVNVRGVSSAGGVTKAGSITAIRGPGGTTVAAGRGASFVGGQFVGGAAWRTVNGNFVHWHNFTPAWYGRYPGCWWPGKWAVVGTAWATVGWATAGSYCGCTGTPVYYDYSQNITYDQGTVYYGEQPVATAEQYYDEAVKLCDAGQNTAGQATDEEWLPLGVFGFINDGQTSTDKIIQLAINKDGVIRGNYQDLISDKVIPIVGSVDKETQRVAMRIEGNRLLVAETGLYDLTNDEVPILVHFGADRQEERTLIRLHEEEKQ